MKDINKKSNNWKVELASNGWWNWTCKRCGNTYNLDDGEYLDECPICNNDNETLELLKRDGNY